MRQSDNMKYIYIYINDRGLNGPGSNPGGDEIFRPSRPVLGAAQPPVKWVPGPSRGLSAAGAAQTHTRTPHTPHTHTHTHTHTHKHHTHHTQHKRARTHTHTYIYIYMCVCVCGVCVCVCVCVCVRQLTLENKLSIFRRIFGIPAVFKIFISLFHNFSPKTGWKTLP